MGGKSEGCSHRDEALTGCLVTSAIAARRLWYTGQTVGSPGDYLDHIPVARVLFASALLWRNVCTSSQARPSFQ